MLSVKNLSVEYSTGGTTARAVRDISLDVPEGRSLALVGESGSGKSSVALSLMRMIQSPIGQITEGSIEIGGVDIRAASMSEMRRLLKHEIGYIPQDPTTALDPLYRVRSQIAEVMPQGSRQDTNTAIIALLDSLGIEKASERFKNYPHEFSGGMKQRVAIAIALAKSPSLLIADEPTTALDVTTQLGILRLIDALRRERHLTTLLVTHDLRVARLLCQQVAVMYAGIIVEQGPMDAVINGPRHPYTAALLGASTGGGLTRSRLPAIPGQPPSLLAMPPGCPFASRCPRVEGRCRESLPDSDGDGAASFLCWNPQVAA